jgi:hypothetical protein
MRAKSSDSSSGSEAGFRGRSRDSSASGSRAVDTRSGARDSSAGSSRAVDTGAGAGDSSADDEDDSGAEEKLQKLTAVQRVAADSLIGLVQAREQLKKAADDVQQEVARQLVSEEKRKELKKMAEARVKKQAAKKQAAEAAAAKEEEAKRKLEADRLRVEQEEQREEERRREQEEKRRREQEEKRRREQEEERRREREDKRKRREQEDEKKGREQKETKRRLEESREARKRSEDREARKRSEDREARRRSEDFRRTEGRAEAGRAEDEKKEAGLGGRCVRDRRMQERLGRRSEERPGPSSGPEGAGLEPGYSIPRRSQPQKTTASPSRSLPSSYKDYAIALPRGEEERQVFQQLLDKKMLFRDPGTGPEGYKQPCFRFRAGEPIRGGEGADRRRSRSPERQETARKRHRNHKD